MTINICTALDRLQSTCPSVSGLILTATAWQVSQGALPALHTRTEESVSRVLSSGPLSLKRPFLGCGSFFLASRSDMEISSQVVYQGVPWGRCPFKGQKKQQNETAGEVEQLISLSGSRVHPEGSSGMTPLPRSGSESGQEDPASPCQCGLSQPLRIVLVSQEGACPGRVSPLQPKHEDAYCWH